MNGPFTKYLRSLDPRGEPPAVESFDMVWAALRGALIGELKRRGLWRLPPSYVGVYGWESWQSAVAAGQAGPTGIHSALDELVVECYSFIFVDRTSSLRAQLRRKTNVDGLVFLNIRNFLLEKQRQHDPLGFRTFALLQSTVRTAVTEGNLFVLEGDPRIANDTHLAFRPDADPIAAQETEAPLQQIVERWGDDLLPDLVTTRGQGLRKLAGKLRGHLLRIADDGIPAFQFRGVIDPLKIDVRRRWASILEHGGGETAFEGEGDELANVVRLVHPETSLEDRESFHRLVDCVDELMESRGGNERNLDELTRLWNFLVAYAADRRSQPASQGSGLDADELPPRSRIAQILDISRNRLHARYGMLERLLKECLDASGGPERSRRRSAATSMGRARMSDQDLSRRLRQQTGESMATAVREEEDLRQQAATSPRPGDVYLLAENLGSPVEWVILAQDETAPERFLAVPADTNPMAGSDDVVLPPEASAGPLTLRLGFGTWLPASSFDPEMRRGLLDAASLERARRTREEIADGTRRGSVRQREVDEEPAYEDWIREVVEKARAALAAPGETAGKVVEMPFPRRSAAATARRPPHWLYGLAAVFALLTVGLSIQVGLQKQRLDRFSRPILDLPTPEIRLNDDDRSERVILVPRETPYVMLTLVVLGEQRCETYELELVGSGGRLLWSASGLEGWPRDELKLMLPGGFLPRRPFNIRLLGVCDGERRLLDEQPVRIESR